MHNKNRDTFQDTEFQFDPSMPTCPKGSPPFNFLTKVVYEFLTSAVHAFLLCPSTPFGYLIIFGEEYKV